jgi:hypothetical protein
MKPIMPEYRILSFINHATRKATNIGILVSASCFHVCIHYHESLNLAQEFDDFGLYCASTKLQGLTEPDIESYIYLHANKETYIST